MFDTMTITKAGGALCGAFLIFLLSKWAAEMLYHTGASGHGGEEMAQAYTIDTGDAGGGAAAPADAGPDFATVFASADAGKGEETTIEARVPVEIATARRAPVTQASSPSGQVCTVGR